MRQILTLFTLILISLTSLSQTAYIDSIQHHRDAKDIQYGDTTNKHSPLLQDNKEHFDGLKYFPVDSNFRVKAVFKKKRGKKFKMQTSTDRMPVYKPYGVYTFTIDGKEYKLTAYENVRLKKKKEFKTYLFLPFKDLTSGKETYGSGRFLELTKPANGSTVYLDFNLCFNPYCSYNHKYSCPIPPSENHLKVEIKAGEKTYPIGY